MGLIIENPLIKKVISLRLPVKDYAIMGGGCMFAHQLKDLDGDIDLIARGSAWRQALTHGRAIVPSSGIGKVITLFDGEIEIYDTWAPGVWDTNKLIEEAEIIDGVPFVQLKTVLEWKILRGKPKDLEHVRVIENYLAGANN